MDNQGTIEQNFFESSSIKNFPNQSPQNSIQNYSQQKPLDNLDQIQMKKQKNTDSDDDEKKSEDTNMEVEEGEEEEQKKEKKQKKLKKKWDDNNVIYFVDYPIMVNNPENTDNYKKVNVGNKTLKIAKDRVLYKVTFYYRNFAQEIKTGLKSKKTKEICFGNVGKKYKVLHPHLDTNQLNNRLGSNYTPDEKYFWVIGLLNAGPDLGQNYLNLVTDFIKKYIKIRQQYNINK